MRAPTQVQEKPFHHEDSKSLEVFQEDSAISVLGGCQDLTGYKSEKLCLTLLCTGGWARDLHYSLYYSLNDRRYEACSLP